MKNNPIVNFNSRLTAVLREIDSGNPSINTTYVGQIVPPSYTNDLLWMKPTSSIIRTESGDKFIYETFDVWLYDGTGNSQTLSDLEDYVDEIDTFSTVYDFEEDSRGNYEQFANKGVVLRDYVLKTPLPPHQSSNTDDCCDWLLIEGPAGPAGMTYDIGQGLKVDSPNTLTLDLDATTMQSPNISPSWTVYKSDNTTLITSSSADSVSAEVGSIVHFDGTYSYNPAGSGQSNPTSVSGSWGTTLPLPNISSAHLTTQVSSNTTYSVTLAKPKSGLIVNNGQVQFASGNDTTSDSVGVTFYYAVYFGNSSNTSLNASQIKTLSKTLQNGLGHTYTGVTSGSGNYTFYCYPATYGSINSIIQDGALPVLTAFTRLSDVTITNDAGQSVLMAVYRSNSTNAFTNVTLAIS